MYCNNLKNSVCTKLQLAKVTFAADPANIDGKFEGPPLVSLDPDILGPLLSSGIHSRRQDLWDDIWTALINAGVDVTEPPGIRTDAHDFVRDGLHMSRCPLLVPLYNSIHLNTCSSLCSLNATLQSLGVTTLGSQRCKLWGFRHCTMGTLLTISMLSATILFLMLLLPCLH